MGIAIALTVLFGIALVFANHALWLTRTVLDTDSFVSALAPLPADSAVAQAIAEQAADAVVESNDVSDTIASELPSDLAFLAVPVTEALRGVIATIASDIISSDAFSSVWTAALRLAHGIALVFVDGVEAGPVVTEDGVVTLDLSGFGDQVANAMGDIGFGLLEGEGADLTIELFELPESGVIRDLVNSMNSIRWWIMVLTVAALIAAVAVATDRRRIALWLGGTTVVAMLVSLVDLRILKNAVTGGISDSVQHDGAVAAWDIVFSGFVIQTWIALLIGMLAVFVAWAMGDADGAEKLRLVFASSESAGSDKKEPSPGFVFVANHSRLIEVVAAGVLFGFLLLGPPVPIWIAGLGIVLFGAIAVAAESIAASVQNDS
jgi:hypothetical protein